MKVTDSRTIIVEIDGTEHEISIADAQRLYDALGALSGVRRHRDPVTIYPYPFQTTPPPSYPRPVWVSGRIDTTGPRLTVNTTDRSAA